jgi:hypothetical protein
MKKSISEILAEAAKQPTQDKQIEVLHKNDSEPLRIILQSAFHPQVKFLLPETDPPYTQGEELLDAQGMLYTEARKMYLFVAGGHQTLKQAKREQLFIEMLESIDPEDAKLMLAVKNKTLPYPLSYDTIEKAYPGLIPPRTTFPEVQAPIAESKQSPATPRKGGRPKGSKNKPKVAAAS